MTESDSTNEPKPKIIRDEKGRFPKGVSGNPSGANRASKLSSREARKDLPYVIRDMINLATKDKGWLKTLKKESPQTFSSMLVTLTRWAEKDEPPPPAEETMSNAEAMDTINQIKREAVEDACKNCKHRKGKCYE